MIEKFIFNKIIESSPHLSWVDESTIFLTLHGSRAYGTHTHTSDYDYKGICIPPKKYYFGFSENFEQCELKEPDMVIYEIRKFFNLASQCNPNIIEVLFCDERDYIICKPVAEKIIENKKLFLSKRIKHTFSGYSVSQLKRIKSHKKYLLNPPKNQPSRSDFGLPETPLISKDQTQIILSTLNDDANNEDFEKSILNYPININVLEVLRKERKYFLAKKEWDQYQNWKKNRNPKRAELEEKFGYDSKHAYHLVRLLRMCKEILLTGKVKVKRDDYEELLAIRNGCWSYDQLIEFAEKEEIEINKIYNESNILPEKPNLNKINDLCVNIIESHFK